MSKLLTWQGICEYISLLPSLHILILDGPLSFILSLFTCIVTSDSLLL